MGKFVNRKRLDENDLRALEKKLSKKGSFTARLHFGMTTAEGHVVGNGQLFCDIESVFGGIVVFEIRDYDCVSACNTSLPDKGMKFIASQTKGFLHEKFNKEYKDAHNENLTKMYQKELIK